MRLQDKATIELTGFEAATALGCLRYINDYNKLGEQETKYLKSLIKKLEELGDKEL